MRGLVLDAPGAVVLRDDLPEPRIDAPTDAVVAVHAAGLCGSDLHPYAGREAARPGVVQGHELVGEVVATGDDVHNVAVGGRVLAAFTTSCGTCGPCRRGLTARCVHGQLFGWGPPEAATGPALHGAQAQRVRIPLADSTLMAVAPSFDDATAVLLSDNLPTAWEAVQRTDVRRGEPLVVVGLGSVGLCAVVAARAMGADPVIGIDPVEDRRDRATSLGADALPPEAARSLLGADTVAATVDAAGSDTGQRLAFDLLRPGGTCSVIAVQTSAQFAFSPVEVYDRNVTVRFGRASVRATLDDLVPRLATGEVTAPTAVCVTHADVPLRDGPAMYRRFAAREPGLVKATFCP